MAEGAENRFLLWLRERQWAAIIMSVVAIGVVVLRIRYPDIFKLDSISIALIVLAILPWLRSIVKSVEVAGLGKLELQDVEKAARRVEDSGLPKPDGSEAGAQEAASTYGDAGSKGNDAVVGNGRGDHEPDLPADTSTVVFESSQPRIFNFPSIGTSVAKSASAFVSYNPLVYSGADQAYRDQRLSAAAMLFRRGLYLLAMECGVGYSSPEDTVARLFGVGAIDAKQADALVTASSLLSAARGLEASGLAVQKTLDVVMNVVQSLNVLRVQAQSKRTQPSATSGTQGEKPADTGSADAAEANQNGPEAGDGPKG